MKKRIDRLRKKMESAHVDVYLTEDSLDFFYLIGFKASAGVLVVTLEDLYFFLDHRYLERGRLLGESVQCFPLKEETFFRDLIQITQNKQVGLPLEKLSYPRAKQILENLGLQEGKNGHGVDFVSDLRMIKDHLEIEAMRKSAEISFSALKKIDRLWTSLSEKEMAQAYQQQMLGLEGERLAFDPIIAYDRHAAFPHYHPACDAFSPQEEVLIDCGAVYRDYHSDMTQTILLPGASAELRRFYLIVQEGYHKILNEIKPGVTLQSLQLKIEQHFAEHHVQEYFLHGLGHGIGLMIHEKPFFHRRHPSSQLELQENMVFTIEPGLYDPKIGGVRLENTIWLSEKGPVSLTNLQFPV